MKSWAESCNILSGPFVLAPGFLLLQYLRNRWYYFDLVDWKVTVNLVWGFSTASTKLHYFLSQALRKVCFDFRLKTVKVDMLLMYTGCGQRQWSLYQEYQPLFNRAQLCKNDIKQFFFYFMNTPPPPTHTKTLFNKVYTNSHKYTHNWIHVHMVAFNVRNSKINHQPETLSFLLVTKHAFTELTLTEYL